jgi:hypothetical protein
MLLHPEAEIDKLVKVVTPARPPQCYGGWTKAGIQVRHKFTKALDSGLAVIPDADPGGSEKKTMFLLFASASKSFHATFLLSQI